MVLFTKTLKAFLIFIAVIAIAFIAFFFWHNHPPLPSRYFSEIQVIGKPHKRAPADAIKVVTYNIHFGIGFDFSRREGVDEESFIQRLDDIGAVLQSLDADIVFLQEVDFHSQRSHKINQAVHLAKKAGYSYVAIAPHHRVKLYPNLQGLNGPLDHGLAILSRYPLIENEVRVARHPKQIPFFFRWLFNPHGSQKVVADLGNGYMTLINLHLDPWDPKTREEETRKILHVIESISGPFVLGGDFNTLPPEALVHAGPQVTKIPWFISVSDFEIHNERTIQQIRDAGFSEVFPPEIYLKNESAAFTFPSNIPTESIDYLFAGNKAKIRSGYVVHKAGMLSDHLPLVAEISYPSRANDSTHNN